MWKKWLSTKAVGNIKFKRSDDLDTTRLPRHIAIIMDGNGRWAKKRGLPRNFGHKAGAETLRKIVQGASQLGIKALTVYAFSTENWKRPTEEVDLLMSLFSNYLDNEIEELHKNNIKLNFIGKISALSAKLQEKIILAEAKTLENHGLVLNIAVNYGGRTEIIEAVKEISELVRAEDIVIDEIDENLFSKYLYTKDSPELDLVIRPSGDLRISNFLLWQLAYAELWFTELHWPDFTTDHLVDAIIDYQNRDRRFGGLKK